MFEGSVGEQFLKRNTNGGSLQYMILIVQITRYFLNSIASHLNTADSYMSDMAAGLCDLTWISCPCFSKSNLLCKFGSSVSSCLLY